MRAQEQLRHINKTHDFHLHLNGSFSLEFLRQAADRNQQQEVFEKLLKIRGSYKERIAREKKGEYSKETVDIIWQQFALIHQIIQTTDDIRQGATDVVINSKAKYLEVRSTPKALGESDWEDYVSAFVQGLQDGENKSGKVARGILSIDRCKTTETQAIAIIDKVTAIKKDSGVLVGIDLSGNPETTRTITRETLEKVLRYAFYKDIGIALHIGESQKPHEQADINIILKVISDWHQKQSSADTNGKNPLHGKVRLGHAIYLSDEQKQIIRRLEIPVEVCPSCHKIVNWWQADTKHPIISIYSSWKQAVIPGTDDELIFGACAKTESRTMLTELGYPTTESKKTANEHHSNFRF